jgi:hypothetical protein
MKYNMTKGSSGNYFDPHRFVLIPGFKLSDNAYFNAELELEHGGTDDVDGGRFDGELELEQFYSDVKINDWLNWRSLGVSLIPVGSINLNHEPDQFYSVHRPIMYKKVIPSTWMESSMGFFGDVPGNESLSWFFLVSQGLSSTDGGLITDSDGIRKTRPNLREKSGNRQLAYTLRLEYDGASSDGWLKGLSGSTSTYIGNYQENVGTTGDTDLYLWDIEAKYRWSSGFLNNFEVIGDYANIHFTDPDAIADANVGDRIFGYRLELAYHHQMGDQELVPFIRAEGYDLSEGSKDSNSFTDSGSKNYLSYGAYFQLNRHMELKAAVRQSLDAVSSTEFSIGVGYQF